MKNIRSLINIPGVNVAVYTDKQEFVETVSNGVGNLAYRATKAVASTGWKASAKASNTHDAAMDAAGRAAKLAAKGLKLKAASTTKQLQLSAAEAGNEVVESGQRIAAVTKDRAVKKLDHTVGGRSREVLAGLKLKRDNAIQGARDAVDNYCMDKVEAELDTTPAIAPTNRPQLPGFIKKRTASDVIREEVAAQ